MEAVSGFLVVWSLLVGPAANAPLTPVSSHYYWSHEVCSAAQARLNAAVTAAGLATPNTICVPFLQEKASTEWVTANVIGPCEPHYDDCGGVDRQSASATIATGMKWYELVRKRQQLPGAGPIGPRPFLTPAQRRTFRAPHPAVR